MKTVLRGISLPKLPHIDFNQTCYCAMHLGLETNLNAVGLTPVDVRGTLTTYSLAHHVDDPIRERYIQNISNLDMETAIWAIPRTSSLNLHLLRCDYRLYRYAKEVGINRVKYRLDDVGGELIVRYAGLRAGVLKYGPRRD